MTLIEKYKDNKEMFDFIVKSYPQCFCIDEVEGQVITGTWSGYALQDERTKKEYFVDIGIRGWDKGSFLIRNGKPIKIPTPLDSDQTHHLKNILELLLVRNGYKWEDIPKCIKFMRESDIQCEWARPDRDIADEIQRILYPDDKNLVKEENSDTN